VCAATNGVSYASLFCPSDLSSDFSFDSFAVNYYKAVSTTIIEEAGACGARPDEKQFRLEEDVLNAHGSDCWAPELGYALQLAHQKGKLIDNALAQLALYNARLGKRQDIRLTCARGSYLLIAGVTIGSAGFIELHSDDVTIEVNTENLNLRFVNSDGFWECTSHPCLWRSRALGTSLTVTGGNCLDPELVYAVDPPAESNRFESAVCNLEEAVSLILRCTPGYSRWCNRYLRHVHVIGKTREDASFSRSAASRPGYVVATAPMPTVLQGEMLVHECTHQYYFVLELLTRVPVDPQSKEKFFSPLVGRERPIERLLVAYHAVANMLMFHAEVLRDHPEHTELSRERLGVLKPAGADLLETLTRNAYLLTAEANAFWQPSRSLIEGICQGTTVGV
jgi:HEXXH motif-containing protein